MNKDRSIIDPRFRPHNAHHEAPSEFEVRDPHLSALRQLPLVHRFALVDEMPKDTPGIYSITGGRQIGKTTLLKQWMLELLKAGIDPGRIVYFSGELIDDHHALVRMIADALRGNFYAKARYLCLDEVSYIRDWDRGIKHLAESGALLNVILVLTGSDSVVIRDTRMRLPGRRGSAAVQDFHLYPLSFYDYVLLCDHLPDDEADNLLNRRSAPNSDTIEILFDAFNNYLVTGGYLSAVNSLDTHGEIPSWIFTVYSDWIRGDVLKRGKQERYLREVLNAVIRRLGSQVTWNSLSHDLSIDHPATIAD